MNDTAFKRLIQAHWRAHGRHDLPWRRTTDPYAILVSEVMLQQTQVARVIEKHPEFLAAFPTFRALAHASVQRVLKVWQGLGYNRRALQLHRCARTVIDRFDGKLPEDYETLRHLPGIGPYTAGAVMAFAFDRPHPVIETNIRRVYLHYYFPRSRSVADARIMPLVERHIRSVRSPRIWYSALMDYGSALADRVTNPNRRSRSYARQSTFAGSLRQLRGRILRHLTDNGSTEHAKLVGLMQDERTAATLVALEREGFIRLAESLVHLAA